MAGNFHDDFMPRTLLIAEPALAGENLSGWARPKFFGRPAVVSFDDPFRSVAGGEEVQHELDADAPPLIT
jgi:hypothetical protein